MEFIEIFKFIIMTEEFQIPLLVFCYICILFFCLLFGIHLFKVCKGEYSKFLGFVVKDLKKNLVLFRFVFENETK